MHANSNRAARARGMTHAINSNEESPTYETKRRYERLTKAPPQLSRGVPALVAGNTNMPETACPASGANTHS